MSNKIQIDLTNVNDAVRRLELIKDSLNIAVLAPMESGSGQALKALESINEEYDKMKEAVITLLDKTKEYMMNVNKSFEGQDKALADHMKLGE